MKGGNPDTKRAMDMINCDADDGHLMIHSTKQYPNEEATSFHVSSNLDSFLSGSSFKREDTVPNMTLQVTSKSIKFSVKIENF